MELKYDKVTNMRTGLSYNQVNWGASISNDFAKSGKKLRDGAEAATYAGIDRIEAAKKKYKYLQDIILKLNQIKDVSTTFEKTMMMLKDDLTAKRKSIGSLKMLSETLLMFALILGVITILLNMTFDGLSMSQFYTGAFISFAFLVFFVLPIYVSIKASRAEKNVELLYQKLMPCIELNYKIQYIQENYRTLIDDVNFSDEQKQNVRDEYIRLSIEKALPSIQSITIS